MEILHKFKQNGYFTAELYHLLAKKKLVDPTDEIQPSEYEKEMRMSTHERLQSLNSIMIDNIISLDYKKPQKIVLAFTPRLLVFQNYKQNDHVVAKFSVKNISKGPTFLNMVYKESSYFFIKPCGGQLLSRLAPGISVSFSITFTPVLYQDYTHRVTFYTDVDQYVLPLIAMGPRPVFDFPDEIVIPKIPLKVENFVFVAVHNIGTVSAGFTLVTRSPFSVQPRSAYLNPGEKIDIKVGFKTMYLGTTDGILNAIFETGENFQIKVSGSTSMVTVELEKYVVRFSDTFKTMVRQQTLKIINKSDHILTYLCLKNENFYFDFEEKVKLATMFYNLKDSEAAKHMKLVQYDVMSSDEHERIYTRIFHDEIHSLVCDKTLQFQNMHFSITPAVGKLWPNKATEITITFSPKEIGEFTATAFLDVDGVKERIPLKMLGTSLPPAINLNVETLDMDCVYINKTYNYEIVAINKGHINGVIEYKEVPTLFESIITCTPALHCLRPGDKESFVISFCNSNQGPYFEEIDFIIRDTKVVLKVYLKGTVIYPSLGFSIPCLDFGMVSLGVPKTLEFEVINESVVDVSGSVKISSDGPEISGITLEDYAVADVPKPQIPHWPREFDIQPCKVDIAPESRFTLKVTLTANLIRANQTSLELELEKSDSPPIVLPVLYNAMVPDITPAPDIKLRACFLDYVYRNEIQISSNEFSGYFVVDDTQNEALSPHVEVSVKEGKIEPNCTITLPISIIMRILGPQEYTVRLKLFGLSKAIDVCHISGSGVHPIVTCIPTALHWGQVKLLNKFHKTVTLCNDSPVHVRFKAFVLNKDGKWQIDPAEGYIEPESETDIALHLYLVDANTYTNKAVIQLEKIKDILVPLSATGVGTSIVVGDLRDRIVLGRHFTKIPLKCKVTIENCGTRLHSLEWSEHYKAPKTKQLPPAGFFSLDPKVFKLAAGEKMEMTIIGVSYKVATIKETWFLVGSVEGINKKELLLECPIVAEFVDPKIEVSSSVIEFQYDYGPYSEFYKLTDIVSIKNVSKLPLELDISLRPPFAIIQKRSTYKVTSKDHDLCCCICYEECDLNINKVISEVGLQRSRTFIDYLTLKPVEPLREGPLHFFQNINKIKMAFSLTHSVQERLEDQEMMKLQILFDTNKHLTLKSRVYSDIMRMKFQGHKNKDAVKMIGTINFPNLLVFPPRVDFQCILNASITSKTIKIQNITPLLVCYKFQWKKCSISRTAMPETPNVDIVSKVSIVETVTKDSEITESNIDEMLVCPAPSEAGAPNELEEDPRKIASIEHKPVILNSISQATSEFDFDFMKSKVIKKIAPMLDTNYKLPFDWIWKLPKISKPIKIDINEVIQVTPHRGILKPGEIQHVHIIFRPEVNINVKATLECEVLGGPSETITVTGQSSDLVYQLNTQKLNFKIRSFHENATEEILITNIAPLPFEYKTYLNEPKFDNELEGTILDLVPPEKLLEHEEKAQLKIVMRPGVVGYFNRIFLLEIEHLPHIPIEVFGWGVIPQIYLTLPRPALIQMDREFGYQAIPSLTLEYLQAVSKIFMTTCEDSEHVNSPITEKCFEDEDFQYDWHICSSSDAYPTVMDIELAIERMLVIKHIKTRPEILTAYFTTSKMGPIPGFHTTPYVIDYGVVITGSTVSCSSEIINYGPIPTKLHFARGTNVPFWLNIKLCGKLMPGETGKLDVVFSPTSNDFKQLEENVEWSFNLEVPYGITIPVTIMALCAVPYLSSNVSEINFGPVRCGDKIMCTIPLKNVGKPTCVWYVTLKLKPSGPTPMTIMNTSGKYEPEEGGWLSIAFKPTMEMIYEGMLIFRFHMNPNRMTIPIFGQGIIPHVHVIGPNITFPPTLPWSKTSDIYFGLTNPCPFPIELIIAHCDEHWKEEEEIFQLLFKYYNKPEEMLVPAIKPGATMPSEIRLFVKELYDRVKKIKEEETSLATKSTFRAPHVQKGKGKSPKGTPKNKEVAKEVPIRKFRTEAEILADEIKVMKEAGVDPLKKCLHVFEEMTSNTNTENQKGLVVFFHGTPCEEMQSQELAYTLGMSLGIPTMSIDYCIVAALCESECPAKELIVLAINESFDTIRKQSRDDDNDAEETEDMFKETEDDFDIMLKKINYIASTKLAPTPRSKASDKKKPASSSAASHSVLGPSGSPTMFQMELVQELLADYFKAHRFQRGFVIDSLTSAMVKIPQLVLTTVLKCIAIKNVHLVLCQSDFAKWAQAYEENLREHEIVDELIPRVYDAEEIENIVKSFDDMDAEEFENSSAELKAIYVANGLEQRRKKYAERIGNRQDLTGKKEKGKIESMKSVVAIEGSEQKKKIRKEDTRKPTNEYLLMNSRYNEYFKNTYDNLVQIANNWLFDQADVGSPLYGLNGQITGVAQKKAKKRSEMHLAVSEINLDERGFPLTLIMSSCSNYKEALVKMFHKASFIQEALKDDEKNDVLKCPVKKKEYTVLLPKTFPAIHHEPSLRWKFLDEIPIKKCECNQITDLCLIDDSTQEYVLDILSKWHCTCGKKVSSCQTSTSEIPSATVDKVPTEESEIDILYPQPLRKIQSMETPTHTGARIVLQPGDLLRCKYSFSPRLEGNFGVKRFIEVYGWPDSRIDISVTGICDIPRLDSRPKKMFENFVRRTIEDKVYKLTFLDDQKFFEFGPIFTGTMRIYEEEYFIDLKNSSLITAEVEIEFLIETTIFEINKTSITLEPGSRDKLKITAAPAEVGVHKSVLLFCVKDNPEIITVTIGCSGVVPNVEILPLTKTIDFGKLLLYRKENDRFIVKNDSILPIMWVIPNDEDFKEDFIIAQTTGIVSRQDNQVVPVTYIACRVGVITSIMLTIHIYDSLGRGNPLLVENIYLSAECYDVMVECAYESHTENYLNFGNVKVNSNVLREMYLLNKGKYNIYYKMKKVKNFPEPALLKSFVAYPECGVIPPTMKLVTIEFDCVPTTSMNLVNVPAYTCSLLDGSKSQVVVAKFPVCVTIASFYNTFTLFPLGELNFHIIAIGSGITREVILNNTSKCPVTYEIILPKKYQVDPDNPPPVKLKDNRIKNPPLRCGNFLILNEDNLLAPGTSRTIQIQFLASAAKQFEETIHFVISDTCPAEAKGVPLKLVGTGAVPVLDFWNIETTFREHLIVKSMAEYKVPESSPHCVFVENSATLHFFCVNVNSSFVGSIDLYNNGLVACALTMKLHYQTNSDPGIFSLDKFETFIEPLMHKNLGIIFTPKELQEYRAVLEINLKLLDNKTQSFKICLIGEGVIPRIRLVKPKLSQNGIGELKFPVTCLGSISNQQMKFTNITTVKSVVVLDIIQSTREVRPVFWLTTSESCEHIICYGTNDLENVTMKVVLKPNEIATMVVHYNPITKGKISCEIKLTIQENPYEYFTVICDAEAFMEDVILVGLEMLSMEIDLDAYKAGTEGEYESRTPAPSTVESEKKPKSPSIPAEKKKSKPFDKKKRLSLGSRRSESFKDHSELKYVLNFGGCELCVIQRRSVVMINNSEKVYKFEWSGVEQIVTKPSVGYISPGEEKDIEIIFYSSQPVNLIKECLVCNLAGISDESLTIDSKGTTWDSRQIVTLFDHNSRLTFEICLLDNTIVKVPNNFTGKIGGGLSPGEGHNISVIDASMNERCEMPIDDQIVPPPPESLSGTITMIVIYSAVTEFSKYRCTLKSEKKLKNTFIYQTRSFDFEVENIGNVPLKISWSFHIDDEYPMRIDKNKSRDPSQEIDMAKESEEMMCIDFPTEGITKEPSKITLFSGSTERQSVDTWFEIDLPFKIEPEKACLQVKQKCSFKVTFSPLESFDFKVKLKSSIDNLDPYNQNVSCKISAKSLVPYVHLDIEESDYLTGNRRKVVGLALPVDMTVLEFNVLGWGCYKKSFNVINPTNCAYEFIFEMVMADTPAYHKHLIPVHCDMLKGYVEGGTSTEVTFTFSPTAPGVYESQWKFLIPSHNLEIGLLVVGTVREPDVVFVPTILLIRNTLVGFTTTNVVVLKNNENQSLNFEFKGNSLCDESGKKPVVIEPEEGVLKPRSDTPINIIYTPIQDRPVSFKIFCSVMFMTKYLPLCVNALSLSIRPKVTYYIIGNEHVLNNEVITNIHLEQTASTYERTIPFTIKNDGSATFFFDWHYSTSSVKKYLQFYVEPKSGHIAPGKDVECTAYFTLKKVPVKAFPLTLSISDGPEYSIYLYAEIEKPLYRFSSMNYDFGKCFVNAPDTTYSKNIAFTNDDAESINVNLNFKNIPELFVHCHEDPNVLPGKRLKFALFFRPKQVREYEFKLQFWVNSLCEEIVTIKGEGIPLLFDLYEGCQKSFNLGHVKVGEKIVRTIEVMNHSKIPIEASFIFRDMYPIIEDTTTSEATSVCLSPSQMPIKVEGEPSRVENLQVYKNDKIREQIAMDTQNALSSLKVVPNKCIIKPHRKSPLKIQFKPVGIIRDLDVQLNMKVLSFERPLVKLSGCATGMSFCLNQNSLQFGRVRRKGCKILKVMLLNNGDFGARFWWQPLISDEFKISPQYGNIAAHANVTCTISFRPLQVNPFIKVWASCNIENYMPLELAMYASCIELGNVQTASLYLECPVREVCVKIITVTNPTDDVWHTLSEISQGPGGPFETPKEFNIEPNTTFDIPMKFKPKTVGKHEAQALYLPLGDNALIVTLVGMAGHPNPNGTILITVPAKDIYTQELIVRNITEAPENYLVSTEIERVIPEKFNAYYDINHPATVKVWGEASAICHWTYVCYEECEMQLKVMFINKQTREYQFYNIIATVTPCEIVDTLVFESRARESVQKEVVIANSLHEHADYMIQCSSLTCPDQIKIGPSSHAKVPMTYSPLVEGKTEDMLEVYNELAGSYIYRVILKCLPAKVKELDVATPLGTCVPLRLRVQNNTNTSTTFLTSISHTSIQADPNYNLGPWEKGKFLVTFEPTDLGPQHCTVSFNSLNAGKFVFSIKGKGLRPKPQGPLEIKVGGYNTIMFKNVFDEARTFRIYVEREEFYVKTVFESIKSKQSLKVTVYLNENISKKALPTGSLTIECYDPPVPKAHWTYFLQGVI